MWFTEVLSFIYLSTGFTVGFGHCIGMCGPIIVSLSLNLKDKGIYLPHILYHSGRIITYSVIGGIAGATGSFTMATAHIEGLQRAVMIFTGLLIVFMGMAMSRWLPFSKRFSNQKNLTGIVSKGFSKVSKLKSTIFYFPLGLLLGLLPCGPVYTALIGAARTGMNTTSIFESILVGMGLMLAFGIGTVPALILVAKLADLGWLKSREIIYKFSSVLMILVGGYFIVQAIRY